MRPLIGISCRLEQKADTAWFYLQREYSEAVWAAGGTPVLLPLIPDEAYVLELAARLDGIVLSGSASDVDPALYDAERHPKLGPIHSEKDRVDLSLARFALDKARPLLGICYGTQAMNVALGGTLVQHLETPINHTDRDSRHTVVVEPASLLAQLGGAGEHRVNTSHHQALDRVPDSLRVTARANDGTIEAVELPDRDRFFIGVQWHPERIYGESAISRALFEELVRRAVR